MSGAKEGRERREGDGTVEVHIDTGREGDKEVWEAGGKMWGGIKERDAR